MYDDGDDGDDIDNNDDNVVGSGNITNRFIYASRWRGDRFIFPVNKKGTKFQTNSAPNEFIFAKKNKKQFFPTKIFHFEVVFRETARPLRWCAVFGSIVSLTAKLYFIRLMAPVHELVKETASNFFNFSSIFSKTRPVLAKLIFSNIFE